jgi:hypothetical protein
MARREIEAGSAISYAEHYAVRGRARGYLPNRVGVKCHVPGLIKSLDVRRGGFF